MSYSAADYPLSKPLAGLVFVLGWGVGITLWSVAHLIPDAASRGFIIDIGIVAACVGLATPMLRSRRVFYGVLVAAIVGIALFAIAGYGHITVIVYMLRILGPFLALITPIFKLLDFRVFPERAVETTTEH